MTYLLAELNKWDDRKLLVNALHHTATIQLTESFKLELRLRCDGFGDLRETYSKARGINRSNVLDVLYDWSHVRDSSEKAMREAANHLRTRLGLTLLPSIEGEPNKQEWVVLEGCAELLRDRARVA